MGPSRVTIDVRLETLVLAFNDPLRIARTEHGGGLTSTTVVAELRDSRWPEHVGLGEGFPDLFYGETPATMSTVRPRAWSAPYAACTWSR